MASLCDLSDDILITIALLLSNNYGDLVRLATLCKTCYRVAVYVVELQRSRDIPWLMTIDRFTDKFKSELYDFQLKQRFSLSRIIGSKVQDLLCNGSIVASKYGWLLITHSRIPTSPTYCLCRPLSNEIIELPPIGSHDYFLGATFSGPPTSSDCVVFVICKTGLAKEKRSICSISICNLEERRWTTYTSNVPLEAHLWDVVYVDGSFYCAFTDNSIVLLGTFNVALQDWSIVNIGIKYPGFLYLVDSDGELLLVYMQFIRPTVYSVNRQFNRLQKNCSRIKSLGSRIIFCSEMGSVVVPADGFVDSDFAYSGLSNLVSTSYQTEGIRNYFYLKTHAGSILPIWIKSHILEKKPFC